MLFVSSWIIEVIVCRGGSGLGGRRGKGEFLFMLLSKLVEAVTPILPFKGVIVFDSLIFSLFSSGLLELLF